MKRNSFFLFIFIVASLMLSPVCSSTNNLEQRKTERFKIDQIKISDNTLLKSKFTQKRFLVGMEHPIVSKGELILLGNKGIIWDTQRPFQNMVLITHQGLYQIIDKKPNRVAKANANVMMSFISKILNGSILESDKTFDVKVLSKPNTKKWKIELMPKSRKMQSFIQSITVEGGQYVQVIAIHRPNGDKDIITMINHTTYVGKNIDKILSSEQKRWLNA